MSRHVLFALKLLLSSGLIAILLARTDLPGFLAGVRKVELVPFVVGLAVFAVGVLIRSYKWQLLLRVQGATLSLLAAQGLNYMALFFNNFFLGALGGDAFRVYKTMDSSASRSGALSSVLMDRLTGVSTLFVVVLISGIANVLRNNPILLREQLYTAIALSLLFPAALYLLLKIATKIGRLELLQRSPRVARATQSFLESIRVHRDHKRTLVLCIALSLTFYLTNCVAMYFFALAGRLQVDFLELTLVVPLVTVLIMLPISVNGIGLQEGAFFLYFESLGASSSSALLVALLPRVTLLIFSLVGALIYISVPPRRLASRPDRVKQ